jgi:mannose-6-phosphate isomerase-like protein (cupin superfamily)
MNSASAWVLGHKIRGFATDDSYGLIEVTSPPKVPGPPPHLHKHEHEFFLILKGELDVMADGIWKKAAAGTFIELPPNTAHTFINNSPQDVVWVTGWRPKGFERFFRDFGIPADDTGARERSVSPEIIQRVLDHCERYGMYIAGGSDV